MRTIIGPSQNALLNFVRLFEDRSTRKFFARFSLLFPSIIEKISTSDYYVEAICPSEEYKFFQPAFKLLSDCYAASNQTEKTLGFLFWINQISYKFHHNLQATKRLLLATLSNEETIDAFLEAMLREHNAQPIDLLFFLRAKENKTLFTSHIIPRFISLFEENPLLVYEYAEIPWFKIHFMKWLPPHLQVNKAETAEFEPIQGPKERSLTAPIIKDLVLAMLKNPENFSFRLNEELYVENKKTNRIYNISFLLKTTPLDQIYFTQEECGAAFDFLLSNRAVNAEVLNSIKETADFALKNLHSVYLLILHRYTGCLYRDINTFFRGEYSRIRHINDITLPLLSGLLINRALQEAREKEVNLLFDITEKIMLAVNIDETELENILLSSNLAVYINRLLEEGIINEDEKKILSGHYSRRSIPFFVRRDDYVYPEKQIINQASVTSFSHAPSNSLKCPTELQADLSGFTNISSISAHKYEQEVLLPASIQFFASKLGDQAQSRCYKVQTFSSIEGAPNNTDFLIGHASRHAFERHLRHSYPSGASRDNHNIVHVLRKIHYLELVLRYFSTHANERFQVLFQTLSAQAFLMAKFALVFSVTGSEGEESFSDSQEKYLRYKQGPADNLIAYFNEISDEKNPHHWVYQMIEPFNLDISMMAEIVFESGNTQYLRNLLDALNAYTHDDEKEQRNLIQSKVILWCSVTMSHNLDLIRCTDPERYEIALTDGFDSVIDHSSKQTAMLEEIKVIVLDCIKKTGFGSGLSQDLSTKPGKCESILSDFFNQNHILSFLRLKKESTERKCHFFSPASEDMENAFFRELINKKTQAALEKAEAAARFTPS